MWIPIYSVSLLDGVHVKLGHLADDAMMSRLVNLKGVYWIDSPESRVERHSRYPWELRLIPKSHDSSQIALRSHFY